MKIRLLAAAVTAALIMPAAAHADLSIRVFDNGAAIGGADSTTDSILFTDTTEPGFDSIVVTGDGQAPGTPGGNLNSSVAITTAGDFSGFHTITIDVFQDAVTALNTASTFSAGALSGTPGPTSETTFWNPSPPALGLPLWGAGFPVGDSSTVGPLLSGDFASPFISDAHEYSITFTAAGQSVDDSINLVATAPEPGTWALTLVGFAALGYARLRKARVKVKAQPTP